MQLNFVGLRHDVDGKVWTKSVGTTGYLPARPRVRQLGEIPPDRRSCRAGHHYGIYQVISDSQNNLWMAEFDEGHLGKIDAKTLKVTWFATPTRACPCAAHGDRRQDNIIVTEYRGNKVAVFNTKTEKFTEYSLPPYTFPYRADFDKNGEIWASTMSTDRVVRMDPKTGKTEQYLMPSDTNMRTVYVDNTTTPVSFWVGSNHDHRIVKVEPLE